MEVNAADPEEGRSPSHVVGASRLVAAALSLLGAGVGHAYLGARRRALAWAFLPIAAFALLELVVVATRVGLWLIVPGMCAMLAARFGAMVDVLVVPRVAMRRGSIWIVLACLVGPVVVYVLVAAAMRTTVIKAFRVPSASMIPALMPHDAIFAAAGPFRHQPPKRGDLVVFSLPEHANDELIKRVVGLPGDTVEVNDGEARINGSKLPHCVVGRDVTIPQAGSDGFIIENHGTLELEYAGDASYLIFIDDKVPDSSGSWKVGPNEIFVLSDNRNSGVDSRFFFQGRGGGISRETVRSEPLSIWLAFTAGGQVDWPRLNLRLDAPHLPSTLGSLEPALRACLAKRPSQAPPPPKQ